MEFGRLVTAMATPFTPDGKMDIPGLKRLIDHLIETGTTSILACGTTGESPTLSHEEKLELFAKTLEFAGGRVPVIAGTGGNNTSESIRLSKEAEELGVQGLLLVAPYYNRPTQDGLYAHFSAIAKEVALPIMLYNIPPRSAVNIDVETILRLAEIPNIVAVKEASGNFNQILDLMANKPDDLVVYSGDDKLTIPMMSVGAHGIVSVASHVVGTEMTTMIDAFVAGDVVTAKQWSSRLLPIFEALFRTSSPGPLKAALTLLGLPAGGLRLPLVSAPEHVVVELERELKRIGKL